MKTTRAGLLATALGKTIPVIGFIGALVIGSIFFIANPAGAMPSKWVLGIGAPILVVSGCFVWALFIVTDDAAQKIGGLEDQLQQARALTDRPPPSVVAVRADSGKPILLLEQSPAFAQDAVVSVYHVDESNFETLVAVGFVRNVQQDGRVQVLLDRVVEAHKNHVDEKATEDTRKRLRVRPIVVRESILASMMTPARETPEGQE